MREITKDATAPEGIGNPVIGIPADSPIDLDLRLEAVREGVLVTGSAHVLLEGECTRCLAPLRDEMDVDVQELFLYEDVHYEGDEEDEEQPRMSGELLDLEPALRDAVVLDLPFAPVCTEDCQGLCATCGANLNEDPDHAHEEPIDARWAALGSLLDQQEDGADPASEAEASPGA